MRDWKYLTQAFVAISLQKISHDRKCRKEGINSSFYLKAKQDFAYARLCASVKRPIKPNPSVGALRVTQRIDVLSR